MTRILPSIASANQLCIQDEMERIKGTPYLHIDIEDGNFLPNITFGMKTIKAICNDASFEYDAHLLVTNPKDYIDELSACGVKKCSFHIEASMYPFEELNRIKKHNMKAGLAFNFKTSIQEALPFVSSLDYVLIMTSEPDDGDNIFSTYILEKIKEARALLPEHIEIWVDGGIGADQIEDVVKAGADTVIMGRAIWKAEDPKAAILKYSEVKNA